MATNNSYPISSNSRTKLNAFRYKDEDEHTVKERTKPVHGSKETQKSLSNGVVEPMQTSPDKGHPSIPQAQEPKSEAQEAKQFKECPQTPGNRIPLADLISNAEDSFDPAPGPEVTPVEHVIWQHVPASSNPDNSSQTPASRRRKRRLSSSPNGSPSHGNSKKHTKEPLDLQSIQALFKTPQHDMAAELWNNYVDKNMVDGAEDLPPPRLANLLSSSPQTPGSGRTSRESSGLRRSISCAAELPTSRAKRRRFNRQDGGDNRGIFQRTSSNVLESGKPKTSRINYLMEKIEKSIHLAPVDANPPGSSPLRQHMDARRCRSSSPTKDRKTLEDVAEANESPCAVPADKARPGQMPALQESSSDFGDDDLDQDLMDLADASADPFIDSVKLSNEVDSLGSSSWAALAAEKSRSCQPKENSTLDSKLPTSQNHTNNETKRDEFDDFDDDYDDLPDNLQEILAKCDEKPDQANAAKTATSEPPLGKSDATNAPVDATPSNVPFATECKAEAASSDDEFDDDFDLEAIEQTMKQTGEGKPVHVCRT